MQAALSQIQLQDHCISVAKAQELSQILEKKAEAFAHVAKQSKAASKAIKAAIKLEEESKQPQGATLNDSDFDMLVDLATRLNEEQRQKLINILLPDKSASWEDVTVDNTSGEIPDFSKALPAN